MNSKEIIGNYKNRVALLNERMSIGLTEAEITILETLNTKLSLNLNSSEQQSIEGLRLIILELVKQKWSLRRLHQELKMSLYSLGVICLKLRGLYGYPYSPFGNFGINKERFIEQSYG